MIGFGRKHPKYKGFILLREYPGCNKKKGDLEPYTSGMFLQYPEIWQPVYHTDYLRDMKIEQLLG